VMQQRYLEWIEDIIEERQPKSAQQKWEDEDEQMLIKLRVRDGLPTKEIAAKMQRTPKAIERKWSKLRKKYDLAPTVPSKNSGRPGGGGPDGTDDASLQFEDLLNSVQAVVANTEDPYAAAPAPAYRPPPAPSGSSGRKRKRDTAVVAEDPMEQLFDPKRVKPEVKYELDAADDPTRHLTDAAAAINQQPAVPILGPLTAVPNQFLIFTQPVAVQAPPPHQHHQLHQPQQQPAADPENLLKWIQQWTEQPSSSMMHGSGLPGSQPQLMPPSLPLPPNMIQTFPSHHM
jgi:transposase-like protein